VEDLKEKIAELLEKGISEKEQKEIRKMIEDKYNWDKIAEKTIKVYRKAIAHGAKC